MEFIKMNFFLGICMYILSNLFLRYECRTEREEKERELELDRSCEELEESLSYFMNKPNLAKNLKELIECEWKRQAVRILIMQIPVLNIFFFLMCCTEKLKRERK